MLRVGIGPSVSHRLSDKSRKDTVASRLADDLPNPVTWYVHHVMPKRPIVDRVRFFRRATRILRDATYPQQIADIVYGLILHAHESPEAFRKSALVALDTIVVPD